jgi:hypothetical protein
MKQLTGTLAAIAAYLLLWFITTITGHEFSWTTYIIIMVLFYGFGYYLYEHVDKIERAKP